MSFLRKIRYLLNLIIRYSFDLVISVGKIKVRGIEESEIKRWKHQVRDVQPMLQLFQANNDKEEIISEKFCNVLTYKGYGYF